jgi:predicted glycosyltransferase
MLEKNRIVIYSHDGRSYGHIKKLGRFSAALTDRDPKISVYCVSSSPFGSDFIKPFSRVDYLKLPSYYFEYNEDTDFFKTKFFVNYKKDEFYGIRIELLKGLFKFFKPKVLFMECNPLGKHSEMYNIVKSHKKNGGSVIWGINGVIDEREIEFHNPQIMDFLVNYIDKILIYNQKEVIDIVKEYPKFKPIEDKITYIGYLCPQKEFNPQPARKRRNILIHTGGGGRSVLLMGKLVRASCEIAKMNPDLSFRIFCGKYLPEIQYNEYSNLCKPYSNIMFSRYTPHILKELSEAYLFIGAGGYNTLSELIVYPTRSIIIPVQSDDEAEQKNHCRKLVDLGVVNKLMLFDSSYDDIYNGILKALDYEIPNHKIQFQTNGIEQLCKHILYETKTNTAY